MVRGESVFAADLPDREQAGGGDQGLGGPQGRRGRPQGQVRGQDQDVPKVREDFQGEDKEKTVKSRRYA